jgi:hypothetical protein
MQNTHEEYVKNIQKCLKNQKKIQQIQKRNYLKLTHKYNMDILSRIESVKSTSKYLKILSKEFNKVKENNQLQLSTFSAFTYRKKTNNLNCCDKDSESIDGHFTHSSYYFNSNHMLLNSSSQFGITARRKKFENKFLRNEYKRLKTTEKKRMKKSDNWYDHVFQSFSD